MQKFVVKKKNGRVTAANSLPNIVEAAIEEDVNTDASELPYPAPAHDSSSSSGRFSALRNFGRRISKIFSKEDHPSVEPVSRDRKRSVDDRLLFSTGIRSPSVKKIEIGRPVIISSTYSGIRPSSCGVQVTDSTDQKSVEIPKQSNATSETVDPAYNAPDNAPTQN
uniref:Uncharacterized protein n=1 Tax=Panagrolaimus sp. PS1159 TaxID=55785 RepID=A0AC35FCJ2_9BILA